MSHITHTETESESSTSTTSWVLALSALLVTAVVVVFGGSIKTFAQQAYGQYADSSRISADLNESYFYDTANNNDNVDGDLDEEGERLAQESMLSQNNTEDETSDDSEPTTTDNNNNETEDADDDEATEEAETTDSTTTESEQCSPFLTEDLRIDFNNDSDEVRKLQTFLSTHAGYDYVPRSGTFGSETLRAVQAFQSRHAGDVLEPWGYRSDEATGYVYITTRQKINEIYCEEENNLDGEFTLSETEQEEIEQYRQKMNQWREQGADLDTPQYLENYYGTQNQDTSAVNQSDTPQEDEDQAQEQDQGQGSEATSSESAAAETGADSATTTATSATTTQEEPSLFEQFINFFTGDDEEGATSTENATTSEEDTATSSDDTETEATTTTEDGTSGTNTATSATGSVAVGSIDQMAAGVYNGINTAFNFLLSPTFLLILLGVLVLLLVITLLSGTKEEEMEQQDSVQAEQA